MTLEQKKQEIVEIIFNLRFKNGDFAASLDQKSYEQLIVMSDKIEQLQPDVKTCQSCVHRQCNPNPDRLSWKCGHKYSPVYLFEFYGHEYNLLSCIHHKERSEK